MAPRQRKSGQDRKAEIVRAAIRLAAELGPDRVSAQALADAVGVSQPAIFRHFATKPDIWLAVGEAITAALGGEEMVAPEGRAAEVLRAVLRRNLEHIAANPAIPAILFSRELHAENEALRAHFDRLMRQRRAGFARLVAQAGGEAGRGAAMPAEDVAALLLAAIQGLAMRWSLEGRRFDLVAEGSRLLDGMLNGLLGG